MNGIPRPATHAATRPQGGSAIELLTVSNMANASLDWHIHEAPPAVSPPPKTGPKVSDYPDSGVQMPEFPEETFAHNGGFSNSSVGDSSIEVLGACNAPSDIPWLSVAPDAGTIGPGDSSDVIEAAFDATGLIVGDNAATLCVNSNDPDENPVEVPVRLHVTQTVTPPTISGLPDQLIDETTSAPRSTDPWAYASDAETPVDLLTYTIQGAPRAGAGVSLTGKRDGHRHR